MSSVMPWALTGPFSRILVASCSRSSRSRSTPTLHHNPMIPHTLVLEPGLRVYKIYNGYWFFGRPTVEELRLDLRAVLQRCRPDWDITGEKLRTTWEKGKKPSFYPYGKTLAQVLAEQD